MPWVIGIDEAGYGPNLGPLVQAAAMAKLPAFDLAGWDWFKETIRRTHVPKDHRILVDDSKKVYRGGAGLDDLAGSLAGWRDNYSMLIANWGVLDSQSDCQKESWYEDVDIERFPHPEMPLLEIGLRPSHIHVMTASRLNIIIDETESKAPALLRGYIGLIQTIFHFLFDPKFANWVKDEGAVIITDKLGGRHYYAALLQETFPQGWVVTECETPGESRYRVENLPFQLTAIFRPKADSGSVCVALASMMAKYIREECMTSFNAFWAKHVPGLKSTAGYPGDAKRFYRDILPAMKKLNIEPDAVWRKK